MEDKDREMIDSECAWIILHLSGDNASAHIKADNVLLNIAKAAGFTKTVSAYENLKEGFWYE